MENSIYLVFSSLDVQIRLIKTNLYNLFFSLCLTRNISETFQSSSYKNNWLNLLRWMFFVPCDNLKTLFFIRNLSLQRVIFQPPCCCVLYLKEVRILRPLSNALSHSTKATTKGPNWSFYFLNFLNKFYLSRCFLHSLICVNVSNFINGIFKN